MSRGVEPQPEAPSPWAKHGALPMFLMLAVMLMALFLAVRGESFFGDEGYHIDEVNHLLRGDIRVTDALTTIPGFHGPLALAALVSGESSLDFLRFLSVCLSFLTLVFVHRICRRIDPAHAVTKTLQVAFLPILLPYFGLLYTDVCSLLLVLAALDGVLGRRYGRGALLGAASVLVRQTNIVWMAFLMFLMLWQEAERCGLSPFAWTKSWLVDALRRVCRRVCSDEESLSGIGLFVTGFFLFAIFVYANGGIAIGDPGSHPFPTVHIGNLWFLLFLTAVLLLPLVLREAPRLVRDAASSRFIIPCGVLLFTLSMLLFESNHGYNGDIDSVFLRNRILVYATMTPLTKAMFSVPVALAALTIGRTRFLRRAFIMLLPFTVAFLLPSWLIEQRYYFIPLTIFLIARTPEDRSLEWGLVGYEASAALMIEVMVAKRWLFL